MNRYRREFEGGQRAVNPAWQSLTGKIHKTNDLPTSNEAFQD